MQPWNRSKTKLMLTPSVCFKEIIIQIWILTILCRIEKTHFSSSNHNIFFWFELHWCKEHHYCVMASSRKRNIYCCQPATKLRKFFLLEWMHHEHLTKINNCLCHIQHSSEGSFINSVSGTSWQLIGVSVSSATDWTTFVPEESMASTVSLTR